MPYWPAKMDQETQAARIRAFEASIYPIWAPFFMGNRVDEFSNEFEMLHHLDIKIFEFGNRPDLVFSSRAGEATRGKYEEVYK